MAKEEKEKCLLKALGRLYKLLVKNPRVTTKEILQDLCCSGIKISRQTLQRTLHENGLKGQRPRKTPLLTKKHHTARLAFARAHLDFPESFST